METYGESRGIEGRRARVVRSVMALALFFLAGVACIGGGDSASSGNELGAANANLAGNVNGAGGLAVAGLSSWSGVRVSTDRGDYSTTTDASGNYSMAVAGDKTYNVIASYNGYKTVVEKGIRVAVGQNRTVNLTFTSALAAGEKTYVGSSQCKLCHSTQHTRWKSAAHRYGISAPGDSPGILNAPEAQFRAGYDLANASDFTTYGGNAPRLGKSGDTYTVTIGNVTYGVAYTLGFQRFQQYVTKIGEAHYVLPMQYNVAAGTWAAYEVADWYSGTTPLYSSLASLETDIYKKNSWERECMGCHAVTGITKLEFSASPTSGIQQHRADWLEKGVGCESCHGPGSAHVWGNGAIGSATDPNITNPSNLPVARRNDLCGSCHSAGVSVGKLAGLARDTYNLTSDTWTLEYYYDGTRTFRPGDTLVAYFTDSGSYWSDSAEARTSSGNHQQWNDFYQSAHTAPGASVNVTCASCHDVHGPVGYSGQLKLSAADNSVCLSCHGPDGTANQKFTTAAAVTQHTGGDHTTYSPSGTGTGKCVTCHMPKTVKTTNSYDVSSHTFRVVRPHNTRRFYNNGATEPMPNSCQQACHEGTTGRGTNFGTGTAGALYAADRYDSTVERPSLVMPDSRVAVVTGTVYVGNVAGQSITDTFGAWVSADYTNRATVTNRNGFYSLTLDAPGTYTIRVMKAGYDSAVAETVSVRISQVLTQNFTLATAGTATKPYRCGACHGGVWGAEWKKSGFEGAVLAEAEDSTDLSAGHGLMAASPTASCGPKCHEARGARQYIQTGDTTLGGFINTGTAGRRGTPCEVCHRPHSSAPVANNSLMAYRTTGFDTGYFYGINSGGTAQSMSFPPAYKSTACIMCHNQRTAPRADGTGIQSSGSDSQRRSTPHVGNNAEGFFGVRNGSSGLVMDLENDTGFSQPGNSSHSDTIWGQLFSYQAFVYSSGAPKLVTSSGSPVIKTDSFTCISCHMFSQVPGKHSAATNTAHDGGHSFKPDIRACGICHDPVYVNLNPYTNAIEAKSGAGDVGYWGTGSWGVSSSGTTLGFDRPVAVLTRQTNTGGSTANSAADAVSNDYDGNGIAEGAHTEAEHLFYRVMAAMTTGTYSSKTSGIDSGAVTGTASLGHTFQTSNPYWTKFKQNRAKMGLTTTDELKVAWNLVLLEHDEKNLGIHNLRFHVETLRAAWTTIGRIIRKEAGDAAWQTWTPPGDNY